MTFSPQDHTVAAGHRIGLVVAGSNVVWAVPDAPAGTTTTVRRGTLRRCPTASVVAIAVAVSHTQRRSGKPWLTVTVTKDECRYRVRWAPCPCATRPVTT